MKKYLILCALLALLLSLAAPFVLPGKGQLDFLPYWSASRLLLQGQDPYNSASLDAMQQAHRAAINADPDYTMYAWNPPWLLVLLFPLAALPFPLAAQIWMFCNVMLMGVGSGLCLQLIQPALSERQTVWILVASLFFGASISTLYLGQISGLLLASLMVCVWALKERRDLVAGLALLLLATKPHISFLVGALLVTWLLRQRRWRVFAGLGGGALVSAGIAWVLFLPWLSSYLERIFSLPFTGIYTSTLASFGLAVLNLPWLRYAALLLLPLPFLYQKRLDQGDWLGALCWTLAASLSLSPYGFTFDQIILLPAIIQILAWLFQKRLTGWQMLLVQTGLAVVYIAYLFLLGIEGLQYYWFFWVAPGLWGLYALAERQIITQPIASIK